MPEHRPEIYRLRVGRSLAGFSDITIVSPRCPGDATNQREPDMVDGPDGTERKRMLDEPVAAIPFQGKELPPGRLLLHLYGGVVPTKPSTLLSIAEVVTGINSRRRRKA